MSFPISTLTSDVFAAAGLVVLLYRLKPWLKVAHSPGQSEEPLVSIIVPCRNESANLPKLLTSLEQLRYANFEIIIVDDHSTDDTRQLAVDAQSRLEKLKVVSAPERPEDWGGKSWACHSAVPHATGDLFLFTDADTIHRANSLTLTVAFLKENRLGLISAPPFHLCESLWERLLASFHILPLIAGAYRQPPTKNRLFAIGQYLLFTRESYEAIGGHEKIRTSLAEDFDLAQLWIQSNRGYGLFPTPEIYEVQMYDSFNGFVAGWTRILRLGLERSQALVTLEIALCLNVFAFCLFSSNPFRIGVAVVGFALLGIIQRPLGKFSLMGAILAPLGAWLFCLLSVRAMLETIFKRRIAWRGREYEV